MQKLLSSLALLSSVLSAPSFASDTTISLRKHSGSGFAPVQYSGSKSCVINGAGLTIEKSMAAVTVQEVKILTRFDKDYLAKELDQAAAAGLSDKGPAPTDAGYTTYSALMADGTEVVLKGIKNSAGTSDLRIVENQSMSAQGLIFMLDNLCGF